MIVFRIIFPSFTNKRINNAIEDVFFSGDNRLVSSVAKIDWSFSGGYFSPVFVLNINLEDNCLSNFSDFSNIYDLYEYLDDCFVALIAYTDFKLTISRGRMIVNMGNGTLA